jgi:hypothetical protein
MSNIAHINIESEPVSSFAHFGIRRHSSFWNCFANHSNANIGRVSGGLLRLYGGAALVVGVPPLSKSASITVAFFRRDNRQSYGVAACAMAGKQ